MQPACEAAMVQAMGRELKPSESRDAEDAIRLQMHLLARKDPQAWMAMAPQARLEAGAKAAAQAIVHDLRLKQQRLQLQITAHDRIDQTLQRAFASLPPDAKAGSRLRAVSQLLAFDAAGRHGITSAESWGHAIANEAFGKLFPLWTSVKGFAHLFEDRKGVSDLVHELFSEPTGNDAAREGARAWLATTQELRDRANAAGMDIGELDGWHYPQSHSQARVAQAGLEKWTADTLPLLERSRYLHVDGSRLTDAEMRQVLERAYDSIVTDGANKQEAGTPRGYGSIAKRGSAHRVLFYKDADSFLTYQGHYGERSLWSALTGHIRSIARDIGLTETLGPNAEQTFRFFNDRTRLEELRANPRKASKIGSAAHFNESLFDYVAGKRQVVNSKVADMFQAFRNFMTATKLGNVALTAMGDEAGMSATAFANRVPWSEAFLRELHYLNPAKGEDREIAARAGLGINGLIGGLNRFATEDMFIGADDGRTAEVRDFTSKLATGVLNASGAESMWDARRRGLGSILMSYLGKTTRQVAHFGDINAQDHGILASKGITEADWQVWRRAQLEDWGMQHGVLTPKSVWAIPDEQLRELGDPTALKRHASTALLGHILEETGMGVMDTGARERARMLFGTKAGTAAGELTRSAFLFKSFAFSMMTKHWARAGMLGSRAATAQYVARLVTMGTIMGALATQLRALKSGQNPANMADPRFWGSALLRGGGLGFYGDFLYSQLNSHSESLIPGLMGPIPTTLEQLYNLTGGALLKAAQGKRTYEAAHLIRFGRDNIPFLNMWYTQAAMDHLVWNDMQEAASPGYLEHMQAKAYRQHGDTWWWQPGEAMPAQGPDFGKAWQPGGQDAQ